MPRPASSSHLFLLVSAVFAALAATAVAGCQASPPTGSHTPITDVAATARSPLDGARLVGAEVRRTPAGFEVVTAWEGRGGRSLVVRDGGIGRGVLTPPASEVDLGAVTAGLAQYDELPEIADAVRLDDGRVLALTTSWADTAGDDPARLFRGLWSSDRGSLTRWTPYAVPGAEGPSISSLGSGPRGLLWITTTDGRLIVSTDGGDSFSEQPARPTP